MAKARLGGSLHTPSRARQTSWEGQATGQDNTLDGLKTLRGSSARISRLSGAPKGRGVHPSVVTTGASLKDPTRPLLNEGHMNELRTSVPTGNPNILHCKCGNTAPTSGAEGLTSKSLVPPAINCRMFGQLGRKAQHLDQVGLSKKKDHKSTKRCKALNT